MEFAASLGLMPKGAGQPRQPQLLGSVGRLTSAVGSAIGAVTSVMMMIVIGIFIAIEPRLYDRGIAWMLPLRHRAASTGSPTMSASRCAGCCSGARRHAVRRRLHLAHADARRRADGGAARPVTGVLAFIPNIGAIISGVLMVAVGFSAGPQQGCGRSSSISSSRTSTAIWSCPTSPGARSTSRRRWCSRCSC
jgi:hypothetical protein